MRPLIATQGISNAEEMLNGARRSFHEVPIYGAQFFKANANPKAWSSSRPGVACAIQPLQVQLGPAASRTEVARQVQLKQSAGSA